MIRALFSLERLIFWQERVLEKVSHNTCLTARSMIELRRKGVGIL